MSIANDDAPRGFVPMRDYLRLKERCEELEERLACQREDERDEAEAELVSLVRLRLKIAAQPARMVIAMARSKRPIVMAKTLKDEAMMPSTAQVNVVFHRLRQHIERAGCANFVVGFPGNGRGGWCLTEEGRAWLAHICPELFWQAKGVSP